VAESEQVLPLELDEDDDGFLVYENLNFGLSSDRRRHSIREEREWVTLLRKSVDVVVAIVVWVIVAIGGSDGDTLRLPGLGIGFQHQTSSRFVSGATPIDPKR
jgi:hypothetical protein